MTTTVTLSDGSTDEPGGGAGYVKAGERFSAETTKATDAEIESSASSALKLFDLSPLEIRVLHPLGPAIYVVATTQDPAQTVSKLDDIQDAIVGTAPDMKYEASYLEIDDMDGTPLARVGNAFRNGGGITWISPSLQGSETP